jgi:hypothetical protein
MEMPDAACVEAAVSVLVRHLLPSGWQPPAFLLPPAPLLPPPPPPILMAARPAQRHGPYHDQPLISPQLGEGPPFVQSAGLPPSTYSLTPMDAPTGVRPATAVQTPRSTGFSAAIQTAEPIASPAIASSQRQKPELRHHHQLHTTSRTLSAPSLYGGVGAIATTRDGSHSSANLIRSASLLQSRQATQGLPKLNWLGKLAKSGNLVCQLHVAASSTDGFLLAQAAPGGSYTASSHEPYCWPSTLDVRMRGELQHIMQVVWGGAPPSARAAFCLEPALIPGVSSSTNASASSALREFNKCVRKLLESGGFCQPCIK